jgi:hypothetical protein
MCRRINTASWTAVSVALLFFGATALAAPGLRGGYAGYGASGFGYGYGTGAYLGGFGMGSASANGYGSYYGSYYPGYYGGGYRYYPRFSASRRTYKGSTYPRGYYGNTQGYYGGSAPRNSGVANHSPISVSTPSLFVYSPPPRQTETTAEGNAAVSKPTPPAPSAPSDTIKLILPITARSSVSYELNGMSFVMKPGHAQTFANDRPWKIKIEDGTGGMEAQPLPGGKYRFARNPEDGGWELRSY